ncbi:NAD-dependent epimerase [Afipia sp. P52-10]|jgi:UDP-glucuronate 4-epimerase|uniref:NAD-dependent epimerase n=1 Tax=Afipia sp. P52-10 TaxID=1429916 RepID=UPI000686D43E|nr:NAD-dependent epimerase [Afipia sp. P52-10]
MASGKVAPNNATDDAILVTGAAGFIGLHVAQRLLQQGRTVVGIDNMNAYYDPSLKEARLSILRNHDRFAFEKLDIAKQDDLFTLFKQHRFGRVIHLAAQPGVRYSIEHPHVYASANLDGFLNILEGCRHNGCRHLLYASSSSVYGANKKVPFSIHDSVDHPVSLYAATKKANELMAHSYSHLYGLPCTGLRFFTVYGPWGRPDMATYLFADAIAQGKPIKLFNNGNMRRDFTYVDDVAEAIVRLMDKPPQANGASFDPGSSAAPWRVYNIGNNKPEELMKVVSLFEKELGRAADKQFLPMQPGDVPETYADIEDLARAIGFTPKTSIEEGIRKTVAWYRDYHGV